MSNSRYGLIRKFLFLILFLPIINLQAQENPSKVQDLKEMLSWLEDDFDIRFSYREQDIAGKQIEPAGKDASLEDHLQHLEEETGLRYQVLSRRYIAIRRIIESLKVCGVLRDQRTGAAIAGATIQSLDSTQATISGPDGHFTLKEVPSDAILEIKYLGYGILFLESLYLEEPSCKELFLEPKFEMLEEAPVVVYLTSGISKQLNGSTHINTDRFGILPGLLEPDALQAVTVLPGVESVNETISNINIRGGTSDQNLVLFDGIKMYLTGHFFGLISAFNSHLTHQATVVKNGTSPAMNDGVSGTISIRSEDELSGKFSGGVGFNLVSSDAFFRIPVSEKLELHLSGRRSINDLLSTPTYDNYFSRTFQDTEIRMNSQQDPNLSTADFQYYDTSLKALYDIDDRHKLRLSLIKINNDLNYSERLSSTEEIRESRLSQDNLALGAHWTAQWNESFATETSGYLTRYLLKAMNFSANPDQRLIQHNQVLETGMKFNTRKKLSETFNLLSGYQFFEVGVLNFENLNNPAFTSRIRDVIRSHSVFSELKLHGDRSYFLGGLRLNYIEKFGKFLLEPRLSFNQKLWGRFSFKAQGEIKSQTTSQIIDLQEDFLGVENRRWILADQENFPIIQSQQLSTGLDFKSGGWFIDVEGFIKKVEGISTSNQGFQDQHEFIRTSGSYLSRGMEVLINKRIGALYTYLNYSFSQSDYRFTELELGEFPNNFDIRHSASFAANYSYKELKFSLGGLVRSGKPYTAPIENSQTRVEGNNRVVNYASPNAERLPGFFRVDLSGSYKFRLSRQTSASISLGLLNLLDRKNIINRYYRVDNEDPAKAVQIDNTSLGFTPNASLKILF